MIVTSVFPDDHDTSLMFAQHAEYASVIGEWVERSCRAYERAEELCAIRTALGDIARSLQGFDHRTVQGAHDLMAAWYRFRFGRAPLFRDAPADPTEMRAAWRQFASEEIGRLLESPAVTRRLLLAVAYANKPVGLEAERELAELLKRRYSAMFEPPAGRSVENEVEAGEE